MPKKILIIDDEIDVMKMVVYRLKAKGFEIVTATSGKDGFTGDFNGRRIARNQK